MITETTTETVGTDPVETPHDPTICSGVCRFLRFFVIKTLLARQDAVFAS